jgi:hypothetical protein
LSGSLSSSILVLPVELLDPEDEGITNCWDLRTELQCHIPKEFYIQVAQVDSIYIERDEDVECMCICLFKTPVGYKCQNTTPGFLVSVFAQLPTVTF